MRIVMTLIMAGLLATAGDVAGVYASGSEEDPGPAATTYFGTVEYLEGRVTVDGARADIGTQVRSGQTIETGPGGLAEIVFDDRNVFQLRENTTLQLDLGSDQSRSVALERGAFAAVFDRLRQVAGGAAFEFRAPTAAGGVRGTTFYVRVEDERTTYVCTCNGATALEGLDGGDAQTVNTGYHRAYRFVREDGSVRTESAPLAYHTDAEMDALATKVGATIPWDR